MVKIIDTFYIRFGEVEDKSNTICYMGLLIADELHNYSWNMLINNSKLMKDIYDRFITKEGIRVYTLKGTLVKLYEDGRCRLTDVNVMEDITEKFIIKDDDEWKN